MVMTAGMVGASASFLIGAVVIDIIVSLIGSGHLTTALAPWRLTLIAVGLPGIGLGLLFAATVKEPARIAAKPDEVSLKQTWRHMVDSGWAYFGMLGGVALLTLIPFSLSAWFPTFLIREFGLTAQEAGYSFGSAFALCAVSGSLILPWIADRLAKNGRADAIPSIAALALVLGAPFAFFAPLAGDAQTAVLLVAPAIFFLAGAPTLATVAVHMIAPARASAELQSVYLMLTNIIGLGMGPTITVLLSEWLFDGPSDIGWGWRLAVGRPCRLGRPCWRAAISPAVSMHRPRRPRPMNLEPSARALDFASASKPSWPSMLSGRSSIVPRGCGPAARPSPMDAAADAGRLKQKAKAQDCGICFCRTVERAGLEPDYAPLAEITGRSHFAPGFSIAAPRHRQHGDADRYGDEAQKSAGSRPCWRARCARLAMTERAWPPRITNIRTRTRGRQLHHQRAKMRISGAGDPRCAIMIVMGQTDSERAEKHLRQSMILVPTDTPGVDIPRAMPIFGDPDAPHGHMEVTARAASNMLLGEGRGFEIAQRRLGRTHPSLHAHDCFPSARWSVCAGVCQAARLPQAVADHRWRQRIAEMCCAIDQARY